MKSVRDIRVIPVVLVAIFGFAVLKVAGLVIDGGYVFDYDPQSTKQSWAQETFNFPGGNKTDPADITGSVDEKKEEKSKEEKPKEEKLKEEAAKPAVAAAGSGKAGRRRGLSRARRPGVAVRARDA